MGGGGACDGTVDGMVIVHGTVSVGEGEYCVQRVRAPSSVEVVSRVESTKPKFVVANG